MERAGSRKSRRGWDDNSISWAIANPSRVAGIIGIYPVFDFRTYPGLKNAAPAFGLTATELEARVGEFNPIARIEVLTRARVPAALIHGDVDKVVPLSENSAEFVRRYKEAGTETLVKLIVLEGQGTISSKATSIRKSLWISPSPAPVRAPERCMH